MRITTRATYAIETGELLHWEGFDYDGPVAECKKGRSRKKEEQERQRRLAGAEEKRAKEYTARQTEQYRRGEETAGLFEAPAPGRMSMWEEAAYSGEVDNILRTYRNLREAGLRSLGQAGFGRAPSGLRGAYEASLGRGEEEAQTGAYRGAVGRTAQGLWNLLNYRTGQQQIYDPSRPTSQASDISMRRFGMDIPSTFSRVMGGLGQLLPIIAAPVTGGMSLAGLAQKGLGRLFGGGKNVTPPSSTGSYGGYGGFGGI